MDWSLVHHSCYAFDQHYRFFLVARRQGMQVIRLAQLQMQKQQVPSQAMIDGACIFIGGALLTLPGFFYRCCRSDVFNTVDKNHYKSGHIKKHSLWYCKR